MCHVRWLILQGNIIISIFFVIPPHAIHYCFSQDQGFVNVPMIS